jgi:hypothetical protein
VKYEGDIASQFSKLIQEHPYLKQRFGDASLIFQPRKLESWSSNSDRFYGKGYVLTGNVTEFLDPIFSSGVMFATVSSHLASQLVMKKLRGESVDWQIEYSNKLQKGVDTFKAYVTGWYDGTLEKIFFATNPDPLVKKQICSVLAGYVWDLENPFVQDPDKALKTLVKKIDFAQKMMTQQ